MQKLETNAETGLDEVESGRRMQQFGPNQLEEKEESLIEEILEPFKEPMMILLIITGILYSFLGEPQDAIAIFTIIVIIGIVETIQERRAESAVKRLKITIKPRAKCIRNGRERVLAGTELVPGDLILLEAGDQVPADARLVDALDLETGEAALTGESTAVEKDPYATIKENAVIGDQQSMAFFGTTVMRGKASAIVVATGMRTELGKIAKAVQEAEESPTPLQQKMKQLTLWFVLISVILCALVVIVGIVKGEPPLDVILFGLSLAVSTIPEDLPIILIVCLVIGVRRMAKRHALIKRLYAVETLGTTTVICTDKTGTLTQNKMTVTDIFAGGATTKLGRSKSGIPAIASMVLKIGCLSNNARIEHPATESVEVIGDPTETALIQACIDQGLDPLALSKQFTRLGEVPFDRKRKRMSVICKSATTAEIHVYMKGASESLISCSTRWMPGTKLDAIVPIDDEARTMILDTQKSMASAGLRVLSVGYKPLESFQTTKDTPTIEQGIIFVGLVGMADVPRAEANPAIAECIQGGVKVVMITGDHKDTAIAIAKAVGIDGKQKALTGEELDGMSDLQLENTIKDISVFARVVPEHKLRIVRAFKKHGDIVAMTGDGINDAPALKEADIGVAMGASGSDVARDAAAMVLADDNFATIVYAMKEGRRIFDNVKKALRYYIASKIAVMATAIIATIVGLPIPLLPIQIILMEVLTDIVASSAFQSEVPEPDVMARPPRIKGVFVLDRRTQARVFANGVTVASGVLVVFSATFTSGGTVEKARTMAFATLVLAIIFLAVNNRSEKRPLFRLGMISNRNMLVSGVLGFGVTFIAIMLPPLQPLFKTVTLGAMDWLFIFLAAAISTFWNEIPKLFNKNLNAIKV